MKAIKILFFFENKAKLSYVLWLKQKRLTNTEEHVIYKHAALFCFTSKYLDFGMFCTWKQDRNTVIT